MLLKEFGDWSYVVIGLMEMVKGVTAFISCPLFGKLSDQIGRVPCLFVSIAGTTLPVVLLALTENMVAFAIMVSFSGFFSATFPLRFNPCGRLCGADN